MPTFKTSAAAMLTALAFAVPSMSAAQSQGGPPPAPDFAAMAADLGVSEASVEACMPRPEPGQRPAQGEAGPDMSGVLACLQQAGVSLPADEVLAVIERYRPEPPPRG